MLVHSLEQPCATQTCPHGSHLRVLMVHDHQVVHHVEGELPRLAQLQDVRLLTGAFPVGTEGSHGVHKLLFPPALGRSSPRVPGQMIQHHLGARAAGGPRVMPQEEDVQLPVAAKNRQVTHAVRSPPSSTLSLRSSE